MCRWITVLSSDDVSLSDVVLAPQNSLLQLAREASFHPGFSGENNHITNGDGFGIGWYHRNLVKNPRMTSLNRKDIKGHENMYAATFRDTAPAWNNQNLREICVATRSHCLLAHVRAASKFASVTQENCHPFKAGRLLFCHNGRIGNFPKIRRALLSRMTDKAFAHVRGTTDSETIFGLIITFLQEDGKNTKPKESPLSQRTPFGHWRLVHAIKKTLKFVRTLLEQAGATDNFSTLNFALTDGESMVVTRFCDEFPRVMPPSLYFAYGDVDELTGEITSKDPEKFLFTLNEQKNGPGDSETEEEPTGNAKSDDEADEPEEERTYDELPITLLMRESIPGRIYKDVDPTKACFVVASNPLTKTHTWNPMPRNSIMWCTRGSMPVLRLLRDKKPKAKILVDHTFVMSSVNIDAPIPVAMPVAPAPMVSPKAEAPDVVVVNGSAAVFEAVQATVDIPVSDNPAEKRLDVSASLSASLGVVSG